MCDPEKAEDEQEGDDKNSAQPQSRSKLAALIEYIKPYKDSILVLVSLISVTSWASAYFVTREQLFSDECRMYTYVHDATKPIRSSVGNDREDWDQRAARKLLDDPTKNLPAIQWLFDDATRVKMNQTSADKETEDQFQSDTKDCPRGPVKPGEKK